MALLIRAIGLAMAWLLLVAADPARAQEEDSLQLAEQQIKAGLLYNFLKYTTWPPEASGKSAMTVCLFGDDPFAAYLQPMAGRTVNQREITVRTLHAVSDAQNCRLLFVNASAAASWPELRAELKGKPVLTVSDFPGFAAAGGMIGFIHKDSHIGAELDMQAVSSAHLQVQDRLLRLVTVVGQ